MARALTVTVAEPVYTAWFGIPGGPSYRSTKVHVCFSDTRQPICGARMSAEQQSQWCAHGIRWDYVECNRCFRRLRAAGIERPNLLANLLAKRA